MNFFYYFPFSDNNADDQINSFKRVFGLSGPRRPALDPRIHKSFKQLNLLLRKVHSLWSFAHYFQWFTGYLKHVVLLMSQMYF